MDEFEVLKKRKEQLELERDVARLERKANLGKKLEMASHWSWMWVAPLFLIGLGFLMASSSISDAVVKVPIGLLMVVPAIAKFFGKR